MVYGNTWVERFYLETDREEREELLEQGVKEDGMTKENEFRQKLWERRYVPEKREKGEVDHFIRAFLSIDTLGRTKQGFFNNKMIKKEIESLRNSLAIDLAEEYGELGKQLHYEEMKQLARTYITICLDDKNFSTMILGVGKLSKDTLNEKIADKIYSLARVVPAMHHFEELVEPFSNALIEVYFEMFPKKSDRRRLQTRLDGIIDEESKA